MLQRTAARNSAPATGCEAFTTWPAYELMNEMYEQAYGVPIAMSGHNFSAPEPAIWRSVIEGTPYPTKALITWGSNPLLNAANTKLVYRALKSPNLDLHVVLEHFMTPTAMLADYVLPAASKLERPTLSTMEDFTSVFVAAERAIQPIGERKSDYYFSANSVSGWGVLLKQKKSATIV
jgi:anaerobic selenocysteine-containing dehydrogenase